MAHNPFEGALHRSDTRIDLEMKVDRIDLAFMSTTQTAEIARSAHGMLINGLLDRQLDVERSRALAVEMALRRHERTIFDKLPWSPQVSRGMVVKGITNQAKSRCILRYLASLPQVLTRPSASVSGMESFKHLIYLVIPMPTDGTKGGFVLAAFKAMDIALGTDYEARYGKGLTLEVQLVHLVSLLVVHCCGLLVIEEAQENHKLNVKVFGREFTLFFMRVMNFGIPLLTIGNPLAFVDVARHTQTWERMTSCGDFTLTPTFTWHDQRWHHIIDQLTAMTVLPEQDQSMRGRAEQYWRASGGYVKHALEIRRAELKLAVREGARRVERRHFTQALHVARRNRDMRLVDMLRTQDKGVLGEMRDVPDADFLNGWLEFPLPAPKVAKRAARKS